MIGETIVVTDNRGFSLVYLILIMSIAVAIAALLIRIYRDQNQKQSASEDKAITSYGVRTVSDQQLDEMKF